MPQPAVPILIIAPIALELGNAQGLADHQGAGEYEQQSERMELHGPISDAPP